MTNTSNECRQLCFADIDASIGCLHHHFRTAAIDLSKDPIVNGDPIAMIFIGLAHGGLIFCDLDVKVGKDVPLLGLELDIGFEGRREGFVYSPLPCRETPSP